MSRYIQEKCQTFGPANSNEDELAGRWVSSASARRNKGTPSGFKAEFNFLPPGMNNENQQNADIRRQELSRGNLGHGNQATTDVTRESLQRGFDRKPMTATDGEQPEPFYREITVEGMTAFCERGNVRDRS